MTDKQKRKKKSMLLPVAAAVIVLAAVVVLAVWLGRPAADQTAADDVQTDSMDTASSAQTDTAKPAGELAGITAKGGSIDWDLVQSINPEIFAWIYVPGTNIDYPLLQSEEADDYYENHDVYKNENPTGALYTELANMKDMCDFNTVVQGNTPEDGTMFAELQLFADEDFFEEHHEIYLYLPDNVLTYEIFAAYFRENTSLIRQYDFTYVTGSQEFVNEIYTKEMTKNIREECKEVTPYNFLLTLTADVKDNPAKQYVVLGALTQDAAGTIKRIYYE